MSEADIMFPSVQGKGIKHVQMRSSAAERFLFGVSVASLSNFRKEVR